MRNIGKLALFFFGVLLLTMLFMAFGPKSEAAESVITQSDVLKIGERSDYQIGFLGCDKKKGLEEVFNAWEKNNITFVKKRFEELGHDEMCAQYFGYLNVTEVHKTAMINLFGEEIQLNLVKVELFLETSEVRSFFAIFGGFTIINPQE